MSAVLSPIISEFETLEQEASYIVWLKAKVQASLDDTRSGIPQDQVMAEMAALETLSYLSDRAQKGSKAKFEAALASVPHGEVLPQDRYN